MNGNLRKKKTIKTFLSLISEIRFTPLKLVFSSSSTPVISYSHEKTSRNRFNRFGELFNSRSRRKSRKTRKSAKSIEILMTCEMSTCPAIPLIIDDVYKSRRTLFIIFSSLRRGKNSRDEFSQLFMKNGKIRRVFMSFEL